MTIKVWSAEEVLLLAAASAAVEADSSAAAARLTKFSTSSINTVLSVPPDTEVARSGHQFYSLCSLYPGFFGRFSATITNTKVGETFSIIS